MTLAERLAAKKAAAAAAAEQAAQQEGTAQDMQITSMEQPEQPTASPALSNLQKLLAARKAITNQVAEPAPAPAPTPAPTAAPVLTGVAAVLAALRAKKKAPADEAAQTSMQQPAVPATDALSEAKALASSLQSTASDEDAPSLPAHLQDEETLATTMRQLATVTVTDCDGKVLGDFTYDELKAKAKQAAIFSKSPMWAKKLAAYEAAIEHMQELAGSTAQSMLKSLAPVPQAPDEPQAVASTDEQDDNIPSSLPTAIANDEVLEAAQQPIPAAVKEAFSLDISLNERQQMAADMAMQGKTFVLIGAAGTGKTTCQRAVAKTLLESGKLITINFSSKQGEELMAPSFAACAFTRRATANLRRAIHKDPGLREVFVSNVLTIHQLLEFEPVYFMDDVTGKETMRFKPRRTAANRLEVTHLVIEEASMVGAYDLWGFLYDALPEGVQIIFIGDINQLPPVFGASILTYALIQLPVIELNTVYRQAGDSGILENAHRILRGEFVQSDKDVNIIQGKNDKAVGQEKTSHALNMMFQKLYQDKIYDPELDMILTPYNTQALGSVNMNAWVAQFLGKDRNAKVYEIRAGFNLHYLAVGDRVMCDKRDGTITKITVNAQYAGRAVQPPGTDLTRFGTRILQAGVDTENLSDEHLDALANSYANFSLETLVEDNAMRKQASSHIVQVALDDGGIIDLTNAGDFGEQTFSLGYVLTGHKAQGCEWRHVFIILHPQQHTMIFREWLYTVWTRAREGLYVIAKQWVLDKAVSNPRIKGDSLAEKIEWFNSGVGQLQEGIYSWK